MGKQGEENHQNPNNVETPSDKSESKWESDGRKGRKIVKPKWKRAKYLRYQGSTDLNVDVI